MFMIALNKYWIYTFYNDNMVKLYFCTNTNYFEQILGNEE